MLKPIQLLSHAVVDFSDRLLIDTNADRLSIKIQWWT